MITFKEEFDYTGVDRCKKHPKYKVMRKPTTDCKKCRELWDIRLGKTRSRVLNNSK